MIENGGRERERINNNKPPIWTVPWIIVLVMLYIFTLLWVNRAIVQRYYVKGAWDAALLGLDSTLPRKITMGGHFTCGAITLLVGPCQFVAPLRRYFPWVHRWTRRLYVVSAVTASTLGCTFILLKGKLVGGWNMSLAFACSGIMTGILAFQVWKTAINMKNNHNSNQLDQHRNYGIRSYAIILSPMLYRYWYVALEIFGIYASPKTLELGGICNASDDTCPDYFRIFDQIHCWTYWLFSLLIAEVIIQGLSSSSPSASASPSSPNHPNENDTHPDAATPLVQSSSKNDNNKDNSNSDYESQHSSEASPATRLGNLIGVVLAVATTAITIQMFS